MRRYALLLAPLLLGGCAGSPAALKMDPKAREVAVDGVTYLAAPHGSGWVVAHKDYLANNMIVVGTDPMARKQGFTRAVERASGCKVVDSVMDPGMMTLQAAVDCTARK